MQGSSGCSLEAKLFHAQEASVPALKLFQLIAWRNRPPPLRIMQGNPLPLKSTDYNVNHRYKYLPSASSSG